MLRMIKSWFKPAKIKFLIRRSYFAWLTSWCHASTDVGACVFCTARMDILATAKVQSFPITS